MPIQNQVLLYANALYLQDPQRDDVVKDEKIVMTEQVAFISLSLSHLYCTFHLYKYSKYSAQNLQNQISFQKSPPRDVDQLKIVYTVHGKACRCVKGSFSLRRYSNCFHLKFN